MNNDLEQFSEERLMEITRQPNSSTIFMYEVRRLARIALAAKQTKPVGRIEGWNNHQGIYIIQWFGNQQDLPKGSELYTNPQAAHTEQDGWIEFVSNIADDTHQNNSLRDWAKKLLAAAPKPEGE